MNTDSIKITGPHNDQGAFDRAVMVAKYLYESGQWDGESQIMISDPYAVYLAVERGQNVSIISTLNGYSLISIPGDETSRALAIPEVVEGEIVESGAAETLALAGQVANEHAARGSFADYLARKADNTIRRQAADLARFADFLADMGIQVGDLQHDPDSWHGVTWGLMEGFRNWMILQGDAIGSINVRLSTVKTYAKLASKAGVISADELLVIRSVEGYTRKDAININQERKTTRRGAKKGAAVAIDTEHVRKLKKQPDTPQGRRDALLMCLLLDHGLRVGEVALLEVGHFDLKAGTMTFYRPKVDKTQTHKLSRDTLRALRAWFDSGDAPAAGPILRSSQKGGALTSAGMTTRAITDRVRVLGEAVCIHGLSAHDCRHFWATYWGKRVKRLERGLFQLQEAGGWASLAMPRRYVEEAQIANEGMDIPDDTE